MIKEGRKFDAGKIRWDLLDYSQIEKIAEILTFGANKYEANNWKKLEPFMSRYFAAMMRHLVAFKTGEKYDPESGKTHLAHTATNLHFLMWGEDNIKQEDNENNK